MKVTKCWKLRGYMQWASTEDSEVVLVKEETALQCGYLSTCFNLKPNLTMNIIGFYKTN